MSSDLKNNLKNLIKKIESRARYLYKYHYRKYIHMHYNNLIVENLMSNGRCHLVAVFKNYLIEDDNSEYLRRFYKSKESAPRLKKLFLYHDETSVIFPNYTPLIESKYLYNNVIRKQRVIDEQQDLENKRNDLKLRKKNKEILKREEKVFNSTIFGEILTSSESVLRIIFGIDINTKNKNMNSTKTNDKTKINNDKNSYNNNLNNNDDDYSDCEEFKKLIKEVETAEEALNNENNNSLVGYKLNSNNALKYKLKLINNANNNQIKNQIYDKMNNLTNNSTNITTSSNNINANINLKKIKNDSNLSFKHSFLLSKKGLKINQKIKNIINLTTNSKNIINTNNEPENYNNDLTIQNHKKSNSTLPSRTLYGLNFHQNHNLINNIINQEKIPSLKNNSNSHSNNNSRITNMNIYNNNYIYNNNFPTSTKYLDKKNNLINNTNTNSNKFNTSSNKSNKTLTKIPRIDIHKLDIININNNNISNNKLLTLTNRNSNTNRNNNYILNNPNLFFAETEVLKTERNIMKKKNLKKDFVKPLITFSPANHTRKSKVIFGRNSRPKLVVINDQNTNGNLNAKAVSQKKSKHYYSNKNINKSNRKLIINDYNYRNHTNIINKGNYNTTSRYNKKF